MAMAAACFEAAKTGSWQRANLCTFRFKIGVGDTVGDTVGGTLAV